MQPPPPAMMSAPVAGQMTAWMSKPLTNVPCPPELQYLVELDRLIVKQKKEIMELVTGWETPNKYVIINAHGQQVFYALEHGSTVGMQFLGSNREFDIKLTDYSGTEVLSVYRPFKYCVSCSSCCPCAECCLDSLEIKCPSVGTLGFVRQQSEGCKTLYAVQDEDGATVLMIEGPGLCFNFSFIGSSVSYKVLSASGEHTIGAISKEWTGFLQEYATDTDTFAVTFPIDLSVKVKALLLGATFLIDFMFFENNEANRRR